MSDANVGVVPVGLDQAHALEPSYCCGEAMLALERCKVFAASWQLAAHHAELAEAGVWHIHGRLRAAYAGA